MAAIGGAVRGPVRARRRLGACGIAVVLGVALAGGACGKKALTTPVAGDADKVLFDRGLEALSGRKWFTAREYFRQLVDGYPQSPLRAESKLALGETYLNEGTPQAYVLALNEFSEFLSFYPTHPKADVAQFKVAMTHYRQMSKPQRDQTETRAAVSEFDVFFERHPESVLVPEAKERYREAKDRLGQSDYGVGLFYYRARWYPGAIDRFKALLAADPGFTYRDAVYFHLADSLAKMGRPAEALPYLDKLTTEFTQSEFLESGQQLMTEVKAKVDAPPAPAPGTAPPVPSPDTPAPAATPPPPPPA
jgi:outer membrane protein assembly factor BamD